MGALSISEGVGSGLISDDGDDKGCDDVAACVRESLTKAIGRATRIGLVKGLDDNVIDVDNDSACRWRG